MIFSANQRILALIFLLLHSPSAASAAEPTSSIVESWKIWDSADPVSSTDLCRFRGQWICVLETDEGLQLIGSEDGKTWDQLSTVASSNKHFPLRDPRLTVATDGRIMLTAVAPKAPRGGYSKSWFSYDAVKWKDPVASAEDNYLVCNVFWHVGVAYNFQIGSICGNADFRIGASDDHGQSFRVKYQQTDMFRAGQGALVFSQDDGYCVMPLLGKGNKLRGVLGVSKAPFWQWKWTELPVAVQHPNAIRTKSGAMLVAAGLPDGQGKMQTTLCKLNAETPALMPIARIPTSKSCFVGLVNYEGQVLLTYHTRSGDASAVHLAKVST